MTTTGRSTTRRLSPASVPKEAIAISYDPKDGAPTIVAKGRGRAARRIVAKAQEHDVPVVSDQVALEALWFVDVGEQIPPQVYHMVAEILVFVYSLGERPKDP